MRARPVLAALVLLAGASGPRAGSSQPRVLMEGRRGGVLNLEVEPAAADFARAAGRDGGETGFLLAVPPGSGLEVRVVGER